MEKPLLVTVIETVTLCDDASVIVAAHVPAFTPVTVRVQLGPEPLVAENVAIGEPPPQLFVCENVPL